MTIAPSVWEIYYKQDSDKALHDMQTNKITYQEWNKIHSRLCREYFELLAKWE